MVQRLWMVKPISICSYLKINFIKIKHIAKFSSFAWNRKFEDFTMASSSQTKRNSSGGNDGPLTKKLRLCHYGDKCYRRNPLHFSEYSHPHLEKLLALQTNKKAIAVPVDFQTKQDKNVILIQLHILKDLNEASDSKSRQSASIDSAGSNASADSSGSSSSAVSACSSTTFKNSSPENDSSKKQTATVNSPASHNNSYSSFDKSNSSRLSSDRHNNNNNNNNNNNRDKHDSVGGEKRKDSIGKTEKTNVNKDRTEEPKWLTAQQPSSSPKVDVKKRSSNSNSKSKTDSAAAQRQENVLKELRPPGTPYGDPSSKLRAAAPYNFFLTTIKASERTHSEPLSITFSELLDPVLGDLQSSLQINFMVDLGWLLANYYLHGHNKKPLTILYGTDDDPDLKDAAKLPPHITAVRIKTPHPFGHHHTKMSLFHYTDGSLRVVVSTANLIESDWENRTQGLWISPRCPELPPDSDTTAGESPTEFKMDLLRYLTNYKLSHLQEWIGRVRRTDFSAVRVFFVSSVPGSHKGPDFYKWGHRRLHNILKKHVTASMDKEGSSQWTVIAQCSSIGSLGPDPDAWMCGELRSAFSERVSANYLQSLPQFKVVYPCFRNVASSLDGLLGGSCLPYSMKTHQKQAWFTTLLNEWKSVKRHRSEAMPHIKTYTRISPCGKKLAWFHLSSANLSKAAWGSLNKVKGRVCTDPNSGASLHIMSYEAGVLFLPKFLINDTTFPLERISGNPTPEFILPYDVPLSPYGPRDKPWVTEYMSM